MGVNSALEDLRENGAKPPEEDPWLWMLQTGAEGAAGHEAETRGGAEQPLGARPSLRFHNNYT